MKLLLLISAALLTGCLEPVDSKYISNRCERQKLFMECMKALPTPAATHYADYDEMVDQCDTVALYQTVRLRVAADKNDQCVVPR